MDSIYATLVTAWTRDIPASIWSGVTDSPMYKLHINRANRISEWCELFRNVYSDRQNPVYWINTPKDVDAVVEAIGASDQAHLVVINLYGQPWPKEYDVFFMIKKASLIVNANNVLPPKFLMREFDHVHIQNT